MAWRSWGLGWAEGFGVIVDGLEISKGELVP